MKRLSLFLCAIAFLSVVSAYFFINTNSSPVSSDNIVQPFVINQGEGIRLISTRLAKNKLIKNDLVFLFLAYKLGLNNNLQAGLFRLSPSLSTEEVISKLSKGGSHDYWLKIIDGQRLAELEASFDSSLEGYIYPDSYLIPQDYSSEQIQAVIAANFEKKYQLAAVGSKTTLTKNEVVILASLLEREARTLDSKKMVSGIIINRLKINMPLQLDATAQFVRDTRQKPNKYWLPASKGDLSLKSPYNTYLNTGLPPTPICNPGYDSLVAALNPAETEYVYYITGSDNKMHYAKTLDEHNQNIANYLK